MKTISRNLRISGILMILFLLITPVLNAQDETGASGFTYQAVARDDAGNPMKATDLTVRISIHIGEATGEVIWQEDHDVQTNDYGLFSLIVGGPNAYGQSGGVETFGNIDWTSNPYFLNVMVKKDAEFLDMGGSPIQTVPIAQHARSAQTAQTALTAETSSGSSGKFAVQADQVYPEDEALFEVRRSDGSLAFAVYEDMVWVYVKDDGTKGLKGGFAVGGLNSAAKAPAENYMRVTADSIRMYIKKPAVKGVKGGFAVGGLNSATKAEANQYLTVAAKDPDNDDYSIALGVDAEASGKYSTAIGFQSTASGYSSFSAGQSSEATNSSSLAFGNSASSTGTYSTAIGYRAKASGSRSIAIGSYYNFSFNYLPIINYGKKGKDDSKGEFIIWDPIITPIFQPISFSRQNQAEGQYSISIGNGNWSQDGGMALGSNNDAFGFGAAAIGHSNKAINTSAFAAGYNSKADGYYATAIGNNAHAKAYGSFVIGQYNEVYGDSTEWRNYDPLFIVGNGLNKDNRSNALTIYKSGRSIFKGEDANLTLNDRRVFTFYNFYTGTWISYLNVYGVRSYINCSDPNVDNYYSGYFYGYDGGAIDNYRGFYADIRTGGAIDVAEYIYDTDGNTEAGDVLIADPNNKESVIVSDKPFQNSVVGIVSTKPHLTMGMDLVIDEKTGNSIAGVKATRLALTGRVPCKVTDENGPIKPGDLVTSSSTPGHAMKWTLLDVNEAKDFNELKQMLAENERRRNAVIGKALEAHNGGTGKIMVLISLQ